MAEFLNSAEEHLLSREEPAAAPKRIAAARTLVKWVLKMAMGLIFAAWIAVIFLYPLLPVSEFIEKWVMIVRTSIYEITGGDFSVFTAPILVVAILASAYFIISDSQEEEELLLKSKSAKRPGLRLRTFPVLVDGPLGVVSAAEFIGICLVVAYVLWAIGVHTLNNLNTVSKLELPTIEKSAELLELTGLRLGLTGGFCLGFLFLPVARGSVLLRLVDIPFEQAARYHVWLGHLTMLIFTVHALCYVTAWSLLGRLLKEITSWLDYGAAVVPGAISFVAGLMMWVTSLPPVRQKQFEVFFYTHQLYIVFIVFFAMHIGNFIFCVAAGGIFLFILDRFLRFCQSRRTVNVISATSLPCGTTELVLSKPENLQYNALSFIFLQVRELSWLQWHPFSVSSSPLDGKNHLSVLIKDLGNWSAKLNRDIMDISETNGGDEIVFQPPNIAVSVEGPYGRKSPYHLMYENLVLVAGGIGIAPFLAILSDILHLVREGKPCLPSNVLLVWAIKKSDELPLLSLINMKSMAPSSPSKLNLQIDIYITQESEPPVEEGDTEKAEKSYIFPVSSGHGMSVLVGTGSSIWSGLYVTSSIVGFIVWMTLLDIFYIDHFKVTTLWYKGLLFLLSMVASVIVFGGLVVLLWHCWERRMASRQNLHTAPVMNSDMPRRQPAGSKRVFYGSRPNLKEIFGSVSEQVGCADIGVIVCGPTTLETSVAKECRSWSLKRGSDSPVFHFNSHTFNL